MCLYLRSWRFFIWGIFPADVCVCDLYVMCQPSNLMLNKLFQNNDAEEDRPICHCVSLHQTSYPVVGVNHVLLQRHRNVGEHRFFFSAGGEKAGNEMG